MRQEAQQSHYTFVDALDQPAAKYVLFLTIGGVTNPILVDGVRFADGDLLKEIKPGIEAYRGEEVVVTFHSEAQWHLVAASYLEAVTKAQIREAYLESLPEKLKAEMRFNRILAQYKEESQHSMNFDEQMRRMWGQGGEEPI